MEPQPQHGGAFHSPSQGKVSIDYFILLRITQQFLCFQAGPARPLRMEISYVRSPANPALGSFVASLL